MMGSYQADLFLPDNTSFPLLIPKFCILVMYYEIRDALTDDVMLKVTFGPENVSLIEFPLLRKDIVATLTAAPESIPEDVTPEDKERIYHSRFPIALSPFSIPSTGRLRVRAHYSNGSILKLGSLAVRRVPIEEFNKMIGVIPAPNAS